MKRINVGLIGFGTVGGGLYHLIEQNADIITRRTGISVAIKTICDLRTDHVRERTTGADITADWKSVVDDDGIDIVAELIGGSEPARSIITGALKRGKGVVTANKKLLAEEGAGIFRELNSGNVHLGFEAAVGGGIPCVLALRHGLAGNRIESIMGILNGTTNYILTKMQESGMPFSEAIRVAQEKGFAEADPTFDIEGYDAGHKIALLAMLAFNREIQYEDIQIEGISHIGKSDISYAGDMGYVIKLLGIAKCIDGKIDIRVHPTMIPFDHHLASVRDEYNSIMFDCDMAGPVILSGKGAGAEPTASAVLSDILQMALQGDAYAPPMVMEGRADLIEPGKRVSRYYIRMHTDDGPNILAQIAGVFGRHDISIASVIQKETHPEHVPLIFMTHEAVEEGMLLAIKEIKEFTFIHGDVMLIRVENSQQGGDAE
ncbi:MAG: homoserine dehydrogenase [Chrysiogenales bacterium]|nr:MAG: homoserine dehydrogenase [Chrysiogenales bacterium]